MENKNKEQVNEEYYSVVVWKDLNGKSHIVGTLSYFNGKYYFKYEQTSLDKARENNFTNVAGFNDDEKLYVSENSLFNFFKMRVSPTIQEHPAALGKLIETRGRNTNDDISIMPIPKGYHPAIKAEIQRMEKNQSEAEQSQNKGFGIGE